MRGSSGPSTSLCFSFSCSWPIASLRLLRAASENVEPGYLCLSTRVTVSPCPKSIRDLDFFPRTHKLRGTSSSYLSRQVVGKVARVRHMAAGAGQHVAGRMMAGFGGHREREKAEVCSDCALYTRV